MQRSCSGSSASMIPMSGPASVRVTVWRDACHSVTEGLSRFLSTTTASMDDARNIGEAFAWTSSQCLISAFRCGLANEIQKPIRPS
jgi:hypothetical protein